MKKTFRFLMVIALAALTLTGCDDVPMPYNQPEVTPDEPTVEVTPSGTGTAADPYNVAAILQRIQALTGDTTEVVYVKGAVKEIRQIETEQYGNANYYITDDGNNQVYIFQSYYLGNRKFTANDKLEIGDTVVVRGRFVNYMGNTPETIGKGTSYIHSLNGKTSGDNTPDTPVTPTDGYLAESFASTFGDFTLTKVKGTPWVIDSYGYAKATGYDNASASTTESESYIVSKAIDLTNAKNPGLKFSYVLRYVTRDGVAVSGVKNQVLITDNYTGNPTTTKWTDITGSLTEGTDWKTWFTYTADLSAYKGKKNIVIALYYACTTSSATWEVKDLSVKEDNIDNTGGNDGNTGDTSTTNGDFETWVNNIPNNWKTASSAGNATLSQSTDAHSGKYSVRVGGATSANKRIGYKELELKAGSYKVTFYAKAATADGGSVRPGYVPVNGGTADSQGYKYGSYVNDLSNSQWTFVEQTLEIPTDGTYSFVIMNSKNPGKDVLIDDVTITTGSTTIVK